MSESARFGTAGLIPVTWETFYAAVRGLDVNPHVDVSTLKGRYHTSVWELRNRARVGVTISDSHGGPRQCFLAKEWT